MVISSGEEAHEKQFMSFFFISQARFQNGSGVNKGKSLWGGSGGVDGFSSPFFFFLQVVVTEKKV